MASDAAIKKSLEFRKRLLANRLDSLVYYDWHDKARGAFVKGRLQCEPTSVEEAARFFGLDHTSEPHRDILLHLLAQAVFGKRKSGPIKGNPSAWSLRKKILLGTLAREVMRRNPKWSYEKIADHICQTERIFKRYWEDPSPVRKQLPTALQELAKFDVLYNAYKANQHKQPNIEEAKAFVHNRLSDPSTRERIYAEMSKLLSQGKLDDFVR